MMKRPAGNSYFISLSVLARAFKRAIRGFNPLYLYKNPVVFVFEVCAVALLIIAGKGFLSHGPNVWFDLQLAVWLALSIFFANFSESIVESGGISKAEYLFKSKRSTKAKLVKDTDTRDYTLINAGKLSKGDIILIEAGDVIPRDGEVIEGIASVDESAITGESASVLRESGGSRSAVTAGTRVISDYIYVEITAEAGENFLDQMIGMVEGSVRPKTPTEISLTMLVGGLSLIFIMVAVNTGILVRYSGERISLDFLIIFLSSLLPLPLGGLLPAVASAGMHQLVRFNVVAKSVRAVESSGDIDTMLLDKTGTITIGNRIATEFIPLGGNTLHELAEKALLSSFKDETPEGKSISGLAQSKYGVSSPDLLDAEIIPFSATSRMSGIDYRGKRIRKGAVDAILSFIGSSKGDGANRELMESVEKIARTGGTPLLVTVDKSTLGLIHLKDVIKPKMKERFQRLRELGIKTIMITGDNPLTAAAIAAEAGVDDFIAEATPEAKLAFIEREQKGGKQIAMCGDGTNDAPALAKADIGLVMNTGTQAAREAGNILDLDSDPTKLLEIVSVGRRMLIVRGALAVFCLAGIIAKYFALLPALLSPAYPALSSIGIMNLHSMRSAVLSVAIFDALLMIGLLPILLKGTKIMSLPSSKLLIVNIVIYGVLGSALPFIGIKLIDTIVSGWGVAS